jgi:two-component system, OmpR family, sensor kinase
MSRIPIRIRLTLPFAIGMALVLAAVGIVIYLRVGSALLGSIDQSLNGQASEALSHAREGKPLLDRDLSEGFTIAEVQLDDGSIVDSSPSSLPVLLTPAEWRHTVASGRTKTTREIAGLRGDWRVVAVPLRVDGRQAVLLVGRSVAARTETLHRLAREFLFAAPAALLLAILGGYALAAAALRPVEAMRRRAEAISASTPGRRLPVPPARDEIAALAVTLNEMLARLQAALEHERRFVADASHELRTPLALLRAELELALRRPRSPGELHAAVASAADETDRLIRLAEDLLLIARSDQGGIPIRQEPVKLGPLLEEVRDRFSGRAAMLDRDLTVADADGATVEADPGRLEQAIGNMVENALVHGAGPVTIASHRRNGVVEVHVLDEGPGLPDAFLDRAFDRFSRADASRTAPGTGLGLAIVAAIAEAHGGHAHAENDPAGGADVWFSLPVS